MKKNQWRSLTIVVPQNGRYAQCSFALLYSKRSFVLLYPQHPFALAAFLGYFMEVTADVHHTTEYYGRSVLRPTLPEPRMIAEARQQIRWKHSFPRPVELIIEILIFAAVFFVSQFVFMAPLVTVGTTVFMFFGENTLAGSIAAGADDSTALEPTMTSQLVDQVMAHPAFMVVMLFATLGMIVGALIYCRVIEGRKLATLGLRRGHILREYLGGLAIGLVMFGTVVLICLATGTLTFEGLAFGSAGLIALFFFGFLIQGMSEELLCRGYFMVSLARKLPLPVAIVVSACAFGALHLANAGLQPLALLNVILFGCFAGVYLLKRGNIWGVAAIHSLWNFAQGNIFGFQVSGTEKMESIFSFSATQTQVGELINGGAFGPEGGLAATAVLVAALVVALLMKGAALPETAMPISSAN
jgi:membrane protease YdiL (CAAX protease family)